MVRLKNQIQNNTIESQVRPTTPAYGLTEPTTRITDVRGVSLGSAVLGLTWTSAALMLVGTSVWELDWRQSRREGEVPEMKEERYVQA